MQQPFLFRMRKYWGQFRWYTSVPGIRQLLTRLKYLGSAVECPYCGWKGRAFYPHPEPHPRPNAYCPKCYAKERHRLMLLYLERNLDINNRMLTILEIAPGPYSIRFFSSFPNIRYFTIDLESSLAMCLADIGHLPLPDHTFDLVICYHVLEHIQDDRGAMAELYRVLKHHGTLLVQVPILGEITDEAPDVTDPQERLRRFGQDDHVRTYGLDFNDRLRNTGFIVNLSDFAAHLAPEEVRLYGLDPHEMITACTVKEQI